MSLGASDRGLLRSVLSFVPFDPGADPELERRLSMLELDVTSRELRTIAVSLATLATVLALGTVVTGRPAVGAAIAATGALLGYGALAIPAWMGRLARTRAAGGATDLVACAVLRVRIEPTPEAAAAFAASHAPGPLGASLDEHRRNHHGRPDSGLRSFGESWAGWAPGLERAMALIVAATRVDGKRRDPLLARALDTVLNATRDRAADYATALRGPTSALYAFGVVLPLALVGLLPTLEGIGGYALLPAVVLVYDAGLPLVTLGTAGWVLARRPVAFRPMRIPRTHPDVTDHRLRAILASGCAMVGLWVALPLVGPGWLRLVTAPGAAIGLGAIIAFRPRVRLRRDVTALERALPAAVTLAASHLERGVPPEAAIAAVGDDLDGPAGVAFERAARTGARLGVPPREAFLSEGGPLATVPSPRVRAVIEVLAAVGRQGRPGATVLHDLGDHLATLQEVERSCRNDLGTISATFRSTAWCFAPLVGGVTVAMTGAIGSRSALGGTGGTLRAPVVGGLGVAIGIYVVLLAAVLGTLACGLERGLDRDVTGYSVGQAVLASSLVYPLAVITAGVLL